MGIDKDIARSRYGDIARHVREKREAAQREDTRYTQRHAQAFAALAHDLDALIRCARDLPGGMAVWPLLVDAQSNARQLAEEWEARKT